MLVGQNSQLTIDYTTQKIAKYKTDYKKVSKICETVVIKRNKRSHKKVRQKRLLMDTLVLKKKQHLHKVMIQEVNLGIKF